VGSEKSAVRDENQTYASTQPVGNLVVTPELIPLQLLLAPFAGWVNRHQGQAIEYLVEENRVLKEQLGGKRLRLTDDQRRRLVAKARALGRLARAGRNARPTIAKTLKEHGIPPSTERSPSWRTFLRTHAPRRRNRTNGDRCANFGQLGITAIGAGPILRPDSDDERFVPRLGHHATRQ
jgi:hypothetical protein